MIYFIDRSLRYNVVIQKKHVKPTFKNTNKCSLNIMARVILHIEVLETTRRFHGGPCSIRVAPIRDLDTETEPSIPGTRYRFAQLQSLVVGSSCDLEFREEELTRCALIHVSFLLKIECGAIDYRGVAIVRLDAVFDDPIVAILKELPGNNPTAIFRISTVFERRIKSYGPHPLSRTMLETSKIICHKWQLDYANALRSITWRLRESSLTHVPVWPVHVAADEVGKTDMPLEKVSLPASTLARFLPQASAPPGTYLKKLCEALAELRGLDPSVAPSCMDEDLCDYRIATLELLADLCTAIPLNVAYVADEDARGKPVEKFKFPDLDNCRGDDCEGLAAISHRVFHQLKRLSQDSSVLWSNILLIARHYRPVLVTCSAASARYAESDSAMLISQGLLICHIFSAALPIDTKSTQYPALLLEGTNQAEHIIAAPQTSAEKVTHKRVKAVLKKLLEKYDAQRAQKAYGFYREIAECWDHETGYFPRRKSETNFGIPFDEFMRGEDARLELPAITPELQRLEKRAHDFVPAGYVFEASAIKLERLGGDLILQRQGVRMNAVPYRFQNLTDEQAAEVWGAFSAEFQIEDLSYHKLTLDSPEARSGSGLGKEEEFEKHFHQIALRLS